MDPNPLSWVQPRSGSRPAKASFENLLMAAYAQGLRGLASRQLSWMVAMPHFSPRAGRRQATRKNIDHGLRAVRDGKFEPVVVATITE
jgi:hypothetical protein